MVLSQQGHMTDLWWQSSGTSRWTCTPVWCRHFYLCPKESTVDKETRAFENKQTNQKVKSKEWISVSRSWVYWPATFIIQSFFGLQTQKCKRTFNKSLSLSITNQPTNQPTNQSSSSVDNHHKKCNMFLTWTLTFPQSPYQRRSLRAQTSPSLSQSL